MSATQQLPHLLGAWALDSEEAAAAQLAEVAQHAALGPWARDEIDATGAQRRAFTDAELRAFDANPDAGFTVTNALPAVGEGGGHTPLPELSDAELAANQAKAEAERARLAGVRARAKALADVAYAELQERAKALGLAYVGVSKADLIARLAEQE